MNAKPWWQSKTIWIGLLQIVAGTMTELQGWLGDADLPAGWIVTGLGVIQIVIRFLTDQSVGR